MDYSSHLSKVSKPDLNSNDLAQPTLIHLFIVLTWSSYRCTRITYFATREMLIERI